MTLDLRVGWSVGWPIVKLANSTVATMGIDIGKNSQILIRCSTMRDRPAGRPSFFLARKLGK
jgi:hypothetical protein